MVFLTFLGMFTNQYVPIWMKDNENKHMTQVIGELSSLKSSVDMQILASNAMVASAPIYSPIQLHAEGVPVFASPTMGQLSLSGAKISGGTSASLNYTFTSGSVTGWLDGTRGARTGGSIEFYGPNRYFVQQIVTYENGAIILSQADGEVVLAGIAMKITPSGSSNKVLITFTSLTGDDKTIGGFGTKSITTSVDFSSYTKVDNSDSATNTLSISIVSKYGVAWSNYFKTALNNTNSATSYWNNPTDPGWLVGTTKSVVDGVTYYTVSVVLKKVISLEFTKAITSVALAEIGV